MGSTAVFRRWTVEVLSAIQTVLTVVICLAGLFFPVLLSIAAVLEVPGLGFNK